MEIKLLQATKEPIKFIADIASISYGKDEAKNPEKLVKNLLNLEHMSTFEHVYYTWKIEGISLTCLAQLTRHRHASFNVQSMRYTNASKQKSIIPNAILNDSRLLDLFLESVIDSKRTYNKLINAGIKKEDARFILPTASSTNLYMSCNLRELLHLHKLRTHKSAQWEIRDLVNEMTMLVVENSPELAFMFKGES